MLHDSDGETEIVLGNKRLLGIFLVVVILLALAFAGGYKVGAGTKKPVLAASSDGSTATAATATGGETHALGGEGATTAPPEASPQVEPAPAPQDTAPLGSPKSAKAIRDKDVRSIQTPRPKPAEDSEAPFTDASFTPQAGQTFLQVAAVSRDEALAVADVLRKKGFHAHAVPRPGGGKLYRVIIGPTRDATDLNGTRAGLRSAGFREIFVQHY